MRAARFRIATLIFILSAVIFMVGCAISRQKTTRSSPVMVVQKVEAASTAEIIVEIQAAQDEIWVKGNLDVMGEVYDTDVVLHRLQSPDITGLDAYKENIAGTRSAFSDCRVIMHEVVTEGDIRASRWTWEGTARGPANVLRYTFQDPKTGESQTISLPMPIGTKLSLDGCTVNHMVDGKVVEAWEYMDSIIIPLRQAGIVFTSEWIEK